jgi:hypothetical protein
LTLPIVHLPAASGILFNALYSSVEYARRSPIMRDCDTLIGRSVDDAGEIYSHFAAGTAENET